MNKTRRRKQRVLAKRRKMYAQAIEAALHAELAKGPLRYDAEGRARLAEAINPIIETAQRGYAIRPSGKGVTMLYEDGSRLNTVVVEPLR